MKHIFCLLGILCLFYSSQAQENNTPDKHLKPGTTALSPLKPGDHVPDIALGKLLNPGKEPVHRFSDLKGKLLIIDFWATSCGACIEAMPRLDSLAAVFGNQVTILPVTSEKAPAITTFQQHNTYLKGERFRTITEDKTLGQLFPHRLLPHDVWIDSNGTVLGFTAVEHITAENIRRVLSGKPLTANQKVDVLDYDRLRPLLTNHNGGNDTAFRYRSIMTAHLPGVQSAVSIRYDSLNNRTIVKATNVHIRQLYTILFKGIRSLPDSLVDTGPDRAVYCYELDLPGNNPGAARKKMQEDLDTFFQVHPRWTGSTFRLIPQTEPDNNQEPLTL